MTKTILIIVAVALIAGIAIYAGGSGSPKPNVDGSIRGEYSLESIQALGTPYECSFVKSDGKSQISGVVRTAEGNVRGDFDIALRGLDGGEFASHLIVKDGTAYTWTSLQPVGYKGPAAKSAGTNSSPADQAQIVGVHDKVEYNCTPWNANLTIFEIPSAVTFLEVPK